MHNNSHKSDKQLTVRIDKELHQNAKIAAAKIGESLTAVVVRALRAYVAGGSSMRVMTVIATLALTVLMTSTSAGAVTSRQAAVPMPDDFESQIAARVDSVRIEALTHNECLDRAAENWARRVTRRDDLQYRTTTQLNRVAKRCGMYAVRDLVTQLDPTATADDVVDQWQWRIASNKLLHDAEMTASGVGSWTGADGWTRTVVVLGDASAPKPAPTPVAQTSTISPWCMGGGRVLRWSYDARGGRVSDADAERAVAMMINPTGWRHARVPVGQPADITIRWSSSSADAVLAGSVLGMTHFEPSHVEILLDSAPAASDMRQVLAHEVGHALGLGHSSDPTDMMSADTAGDRHGLSPANVRDLRAIGAAGLSCGGAS